MFFRKKQSYQSSPVACAEIQCLEQRLLLSADGFLSVTDDTEKSWMPSEPPSEISVIHTSVDQNFDVASSVITYDNSGDDDFFTTDSEQSSADNKEELANIATPGASGDDLAEPSTLIPLLDSVDDNTELIQLQVDNTSSTQSFSSTVSIQVRPQLEEPSLLLHSDTNDFRPSELTLAQTRIGPPAGTAAEVDDINHIVDVLNSELKTFLNELDDLSSFFDVSQLKVMLDGLVAYPSTIFPVFEHTGNLPLNSVLGIASAVSNMVNQVVQDADDFQGLVHGMTKVALVDLLESFGFEVTAVFDGLQDSNHNLPATVHGKLIEFNLIRSLNLSEVTAVASITQMVDGFLNGISDQFGLHFNYDLDGNIVLSIHFAADETGLFFLSDSKIDLNLDASASTSGTASILSTDVTVSGNLTSDLLLTLTFSDTGKNFYFLDLADFADNLTILTVGTYVMNVGFAAKGFNLNYTYGQTFTADFPNRIVFANSSQTLSGLLSLPEWKDASNLPVSVTIIGSYNSILNSWTLTGSLASAFILSQEIRDVSIQVIISENGLSGSGSASLVLLPFQSQNQPVNISLAVVFDNSLVTFTGALTVAQLNYLTQNNITLFRLNNGNLAVTIASDYNSITTASVSLQIGSASLDTGNSSIHVQLTDGDDLDAYALIGDFDLVDGHLQVTADHTVAYIHSILWISAIGITFSFNRKSQQNAQKLTEINSATISFNVGGFTADGIINGVEIFSNGLKVSSTTIALSNLNLGPLSLTGVSATLTDLDTTGSIQGEVTVTATGIALNLGSSVNATVSNLSIAVDLASASTFTVEFDFVASVAGGVLKITATDVVINPSGSPVATIASAGLELNIGGVAATGTLNGLQVFNNGLKIANANLSLGNLNLGPLSLIGANTTIINLDTTGSIKGVITVTATTVGLNLGNSVSTTVSNLSISVNLANSSAFVVKFDFTANIANGLLTFAATNVVITPSANPVTTITNAVMTLNVGGVIANGSLSGLQIYNNGLKLSSAILSLGNLTLGPVRLVGVTATFTNIDTRGVTKTGMITLSANLIGINLGSTVTATVSYFSANVNLSTDTAFVIQVDFTATIANGLVRITANNVIISPSSDPVVTIATASLQLNIGGIFATGTITGLVVYNNGLYLVRATISLGNLTLGPVSLVNVFAVIEDLDTRGGVAGTINLTADLISLNLGSAVVANVTDFEVSVNLANESAFTIKLSLTISIANGLIQIVAEDVVISPAGNPVASITNAMVYLNVGGVTATGTISGLALHEDGISLASGSLSLGDLTLGPVSLAGAVATVINLNTRSGNLTGVITISATTITLNLGTAVIATVTNFSASVNLANTSEFVIKFDFIANIANGVIQLRATQVVINPSSNPVVLVSAATLQLNIGGITVTGTISGLGIYNNGLRIASATVSLSDLILGPVSLIGATATLTNLDTRGGTISGVVIINASNISLNLGSTVDSQISDFSAQVNLANASAFVVQFDLLVNVGQGAVQIAAEDVIIDPVGSPVANIASATLTLNFGGLSVTGAVSGLKIYDDGFTLESSSASVESFHLGPISLVGVRVNVTALNTRAGASEGMVTITADSISLNLGGAVNTSITNFSAVLDLSDADKFVITLDFTASLANGAITITATQVEIHPDEAPVATIDTATLELNLGGVMANGTLNGLELFEDGLYVESSTIALGNMVLGPISLVGVSATISDLDSRTPEGIVTISATSLSLNLGSAVTTGITDFVANIDIANASAFTIRFDFTASIANSAVLITADDVYISPSSSPVATVALASLQLNLGGVNVTGELINLAIYNNGIALLSGTVSLADLTLGPVVLSGVSATLTNLDTRAGINGVITINASNISLNLGSAINATITDFSTSINLANSTAFTIKFDLSASIAGGVVVVTADDVIISPDEAPVATIGSADIALNIAGVAANGTLTGLEIYNNGLRLTSGTVNLGSITLGPISLTGVNANITNLDTRGITSGVISIQATTIALNLGTAIHTTISNFSTSINLTNSSAFTVEFDFTASIANDVILISATDVVITPASNPVTTIATASITLNISGITANGSILGLEIYNDGIKLVSGSITLGDLTLGPVGLVNVSANINNLDTRGATNSGMITITAQSISLNLGSAVQTTITEFSTSIDLANSSAFTVKLSFNAKIANGVVEITANDVSISPVGNPVASIGDATVLLKLGSLQYSGTLAGLQVFNNGIRLASGTIALPNMNLGPVSLSGVSAVVTNLDTTTGSISGVVAINATLIGINLGGGGAITATIANFSATINLSNASAFTIKFDLAVNMANGNVQITANNVVISPGSNPVATITSATFRLSIGGVIVNGSLNGLEVYDNGLRLASGSISLSNLALGPLTMNNVTVAVTNLDTRSSLTGTITVSASSFSLNLGSATQTTISGLEVSLNLANASDFTIKFSFTASIASGVIVISASDVFINPTGNPVATIASATIQLKFGTSIVTGTISGLQLFNNGIKLVSASLTLPNMNLGPASVSGLTGTINNLDTTGTSISGIITISTISVNLNLGSAVQSTVTNFSISLNLANASEFTIKFDMSLSIASGVVKLSATNVIISPGSNPVASIGTATLTIRLSPGNEITGSVSSLLIYDNGLTLGGASISLPNITLGGIVVLNGVTVTLSAIDTRQPSLTGTVTVNASTIALNVGSAVNASLTNFSANINLANPGDLVIHGDLALNVLNNTLIINAVGVDISTTGSVLVDINSIAVKIPALDANNPLATATGLQISSNGIVSVVSLTVNTGAITQTLGFGNFLPLTIDQLKFDFLGDLNNNDQRDVGEVFNVAEFDIIVKGKFDFSKFGSLPFTPIIKIGSGASAQTFEKNTPSADNYFEFSVRFINGEIRPWSIGPIELGIKDLIAGPIKIGGSIILGGYQNGEFVTTFGGSLTVEATGNMNNLTFGASISVLGSFDDDTGVLNVTATFLISFKFHDYITVQNAGVTFRFTSQKQINGNLTFDNFEVLAGQVQLVKITIGSYLELLATNVTINFNPGPGQYLATFGSISASIPAIGIGGGAFNFAISAEGNLVPLTGFGISLSVSSSGALSWPSWLPIQITYLAIVWPNFNPATDVFVDEMDEFQIVMSASINNIPGLPVEVSGSFNNVVFDVSLLVQGKFPITDIGSASVIISGDLGGGQISGGLVLGILKLDADNKIIGDNGPNGNPNPNAVVASRTLYAAIRGGFTIAGIGGFEIAIGISELGPLDIYFRADIPIILDPVYTGLTISGFRGRVIFGDPFPEITKPEDLAGGAFNPPTYLTAAEWDAQLRNLVRQQFINNNGQVSWNIFAGPLTIAAGATLYSSFISPLTFTADVDIMLTTNGKFFINARATFFSFVTLDMRLFFDLSKIASGQFSVFFLARFPSSFPLIQLRGSLEIYPHDVDGNKVLANDPNAVGVTLKIVGGLDVGPISFGVGITAEGIILFRLEMWDDDSNPSTPKSFRMTLDIDAFIQVKYLVGEFTIAAAKGKFAFEKNIDDTYVLYGAFALLPNSLDFLNAIGLDFNGGMLFRINTGANDRDLFLDFGSLYPDIPSRTYTLYANSMSFMIWGSLTFSLGGTTWFVFDGTYYWEIYTINDSDGLFGTADLTFGIGWRIYINARLILGPSSNPWITFGALGFLQIELDPTGMLSDGFKLPLGIAAMLRVGVDTNFGDALNMEISGLFTVYLNTTLRNIEFSIPPPSPADAEMTGAGDIVVTPLTATTVYIPAGAPTLDPRNIPPDRQLYSNEQEAPSPYLYIAVTGVGSGQNATINLFDTFVIEGAFVFSVSTNQLRIQFFAEMKLQVGTGASKVSIFEFMVEGAILVSYQIVPTLNIGAAGVLVLTLKAGSGPPSSIGEFGFSDNGAGLQFYLAFNTWATSKTFTSFSNSSLVKEYVIPGGTQLGPIVIPYLKIYVRAWLTVGTSSTGFLFDGQFYLELGNGELKIAAIAVLRLKIAGTTILSFDAIGAFYVGTQGFGAMFELKLTLQAPPSYGIYFNMTFQLQINTSSNAIHFDTDGNGVADLTIQPGPFFQIYAAGALRILVVELTGSVLIRMAEGAIDLAATLTLDLRVGSLTLFTFNFTGAIRIGLGGVAASITLALNFDPGLPSVFRFKISASFTLQINTTGSAVSWDIDNNGSPDIVLPGGFYFRLYVVGDVQVAGFRLHGTFLFEKFGSMVLVQVTAELIMELPMPGGGWQKILSFNVEGFFLITSNGFAAGLSIDLSFNMPDNVYGFRFDGGVTARVEINFTNQALVIGSFNLEAGNYARLIITANLAGGFVQNGQPNFVFAATFTVTATFNQFFIPTGFEILADGYLSIRLTSNFTFQIDVFAIIGVYWDGLILAFGFGLDINIANFITIEGDFIFKLNTTDTTRTYTMPSSGRTITLQANTLAILVEGPHSITVDGQLKTKLAKVKFGFSFSGGTFVGLVAYGGFELTLFLNKIGFEVSLTLYISLTTGNAIAKLLNLDVVFVISGTIKTTVSIAPFDLYLYIDIYGSISFTFNLAGIVDIQVSISADLELEVKGVSVTKFKVALEVIGTGNLDLKIIQFGIALAGRFDTTGGFYMAAAAYANFNANFGPIQVNFGVNAGLYLAYGYALVSWDNLFSKIPLDINDVRTSFNKSPGAANWGFYIKVYGGIKIKFSIDLGLFEINIDWTLASFEAILAFNSAGDLQIKFNVTIAGIGFGFTINIRVGGGSQPPDTQEQNGPPGYTATGVTATTSLTVNEGSTTPIGVTVTTVDGSKTSSYTYEIFDHPDYNDTAAVNHLTITASGANASINDPGGWDYDSSNGGVYSTSIRVRDNPNIEWGGSNITITVVNQPPAQPPAASPTVDKDITGTIINAGTTDPGGGTVNYSLSGADASKFTINSSGQVTRTGTLNDNSTYNITVIAADSQGLTSSRAYVITTDGP